VERAAFFFSEGIFEILVRPCTGNYDMAGQARRTLRLRGWLALAHLRPVEADFERERRIPVCDSAQATGELRKQIKTLQDSALYLNDLANQLPEHSDWLWRLAMKLTSEAESLQQRLESPGEETE
jgi:hypothetical protein